MKNFNILILIIFLLLFSSGSIEDEIDIRNKFDSMCDPVYIDTNIIYIDSCNVIKIKEREKFYLIYLQKDNCIFKLISDKTDSLTIECNKLIEGNEYNNIYISSVFYIDDDFYLVNRADIGGLYYGNETITIEGDSVVGDLFYGKNIHDLYVCEIDSTLLKE